MPSPFPNPSAQKKAPAQSWKAWAVRIAFIIVAFAGGRYLAGHPVGSGASTSNKNDVSSQVITKKSGPTSADEMAVVKEKLAESLHTPGRWASGLALEDYVATLNSDTVKALLNDLNTQGLTSDNSRALRCLMRRWAELDPQAAIGWVLNSAEPSKKFWCMDALFDGLSARDPAAALTALAQFRGQRGADSEVDRIFENYARQNPQAALAALQNLPPGQQTPDVYSSMFTAWADRDPLAAATAGAGLPPSATRNQTLSAIAQSWAQQDPAASLAWAQTLQPGKIQDGAVDAAIQVVGQNDPAQAAKDAMQLPHGANRDDLLNTILNNWVQSDPAQLLNWAGNNLTGANYITVALAALQQESTTDPAAAAAAAQNALGNLTGLTQDQQSALQKVVDKAPAK